jgi:hypothetical protein
MFQAGISGIEPFDCESSHANLGATWSTWLKRFELFALAAGITDDERRRALLIHCGGKKLFDLVNTMTVVPRLAAENRPAETQYDALKRTLNEHFTAKRNPEYGEYVFRKTKQAENETIDQYCTRLKQLAEECDFEDNDKAIKRQIIHAGDQAI